MVTISLQTSHLNIGFKWLRKLENSSKSRLEMDFLLTETGLSIPNEGLGPSEGLNHERRNKKQSHSMRQSLWTVKP